MKNIFFAVLLLVCGSISAQEIVWETLFSDAAQVSKNWNFYDRNNNGNGWIIGKNWYQEQQADGTRKTKEGTETVLRYSLTDINGQYSTGYYDEDWAITKEIDLTSASGKIQLVVLWKPVEKTGRRTVFIRESSDLDGFVQMEDQHDLGQIFVPYGFGTDSETVIPQDPNQFAESIIDISEFAGKKIYIGLISANRDWESGNVNTPINISEISIYAEKVLATNEVKAGKSLTKVAQNPVGNSLMLQLNPAMAAAKTAVQVYSTAGQQVLNAKYAKELNVSALAPGMYLARVSDGTLTETVKFIKK